MENLGSSFCLRIIAFLAIRQILQSSVERSADHGQQFLGFFVGRSGGADADIHAANLIDLVVFDFREDQLFLEIEYDKVDKVRGMDVIVVTTAETDEEARELLTQFGMPFKK